jgi:hypothetical protein
MDMDHRAQLRDEAVKAFEPQSLRRHLCGNSGKPFYGK